ncbi:AAA family ATPase [Arthrobacter sp. FX8]|uniref:AAA family ATPase n=1 Tax=Arthrobacter sp. FX8 TaxID=2997335 RepID=UPI00227C5233|nr:AAA family ATPase [Arthrobacter sp. FX8]WAJ33812.1 AAA family ATPase [Arthrobacter sp. FX8]
MIEAKRVFDEEEFTERPRFLYAELRGLLGEFNHRVELPNGQEMVILYGPNGVGKTHVLEFIHHALRGDWFRLQDMPFDSAEIGYDDGRALRFRFELTDRGVESDSPRRRALVSNAAPPLLVTLETDEATHVWQGPLRDFSDASPMMIRRVVERELGYRRVEPDMYLQPASDKRLSFAEVVSAESKNIHKFLSSRYLDASADLQTVIPDAMQDYIDEDSSILVETQRLIMTQAGTPTTRERSSQPLLAIDQVSRSVQSLMEQALADNSRLSQRLDRTFPSRLFEPDAQVASSEKEIRQLHQDQQDFRSRLANYHLGGEDESNVELPQRPLESWEVKVLGRYLQDSARKLESFHQLLDKLDLFMNTLNSRFFRKRIYLTSERSLAIENTRGDTLTVSDLSSGEQHELILLKYLLFDTNPGSIVLIDEPEISLHVSWQKAFLEDLSHVSSISSLRFIIATHSPQIINNSWHLTTPLGGPIDEW